MASLPDSQALIAPATSKSDRCFYAIVIVWRCDAVVRIRYISAEPMTLVGIVSADTMVAYTTDPRCKTFHDHRGDRGIHGCDLACWQDYYAYVMPHCGVWKARFSLDPVAQPKIGKRSDQDLARTAG
jgi:hypothetical protein